ncbi:MAG: DUF4012 domain-containing protein [Anaerolineae bacterium]
MTSKPIRWRRIILLVIIVALLVWLGFIARTVLTLRGDVLALQDYAARLPSPMKPTEIDLALIQGHVTSIHQNLSSLRTLGAPLLAVTPALGWLPEIGGDVRAAPALLDMALEFTDIGDRATRMLVPFWPPPEGSGRLSLEMMTRVLQVLQPAMKSFRGNIDRAEADRQRIETAALSPRLRSLLERFDATYPALSTGLNLASVAPQLLGADRPRTYLIMLQNEDELRPTGGFISAAGHVTLDAGKIVSLTVSDSYALDDFKQYYPDPPEPLLRYMGSQMWLFRDSNWSPDFPTAARQAIEFYTYTQQVNIDGVMALNQNVIEAVLSGLGPLTIDPAQPPLTAQTIRAYMRKAWSPDGTTDFVTWIYQRKDFIGRVMQAMLDRVLNQTQQVDWPTLGQALDRVLRSRDLLITLIDPKLNDALHATHSDGALIDAPGDYLMIVDANLGFNKVNAVVREAITHTVHINADDAVTSELQISYTNGAADTHQPCKHQPPDYSLSTTYDQLTQDCYWDYRRVVVPNGARLIDATRLPTRPGELITGALSDGATEVLTETGHTALGTFLVVRRGATIESSVRYALPDGIIQHDGDRRVYHLHVQKQSGAGQWPLRIQVQWPTNWQLVDAQPAPTRVSATGAEYELTFSADVDLTITLR